IGELGVALFLDQSDAGHHAFASRSANFSFTRASISGLARDTFGKSFRRSNGRQASMMARLLLYAFDPCGMIGSSGLDHMLRSRSMSSAGSQRVHMAQSTSNTSVGSTSSSTTTVNLPR